MRIMLDTNVILSLLLFPGPRMNAMMEYIFTRNELVLSSFVVDELRDVICRKFPNRIAVIDMFLEQISYDLVDTPDKIPNGLFEIRDVKDYPVLYTAVIGDVEVLITGDKDFSEVNVLKPEIMTPNEFINKYIVR